ncbi:hypothetical protein BMT54_03515 [Pasteurellaceae bacterium 15-036681]|nr:hypothetical protein BMT54_03515 [Pasteurellaceae bacterium 15-036681]
MLDLQTQISNAQRFVERWANYTDEKSGKDSFYNEFFAIFGIDRVTNASFEWRVKSKNSKETKFADLFWEGVFLAEHKTTGKNLEDAKLQAENYLAKIKKTKPDLMPKFYAVSDFANFHLYSVKDTDFALKFPLTELPHQIENNVFSFMLGHEGKIRADEERANTHAAEQIGHLYNAFKERNVYSEHEMRLMITRLLFLLFADDSAVWTERNNLFFDLIDEHTSETGSDVGIRLNELFEVLNTPLHLRDCLPEYQIFDYVNGGLFAEHLRTFRFDAELRQLLLNCCEIDWAQISPEIFGTIFQSVMEKQVDETGKVVKDERREKGAHYTEKANIEKVINNLFLNELKAELQAVNSLGKKAKVQAYSAFHQKLASLSFLDPACGCGNFLIIAYEAMRRLENDLFEAMYFDGKAPSAQLGFSEAVATVQLSPTQFYGIEIDGFATMIAKVAMWLKDHQCNLETKRRFGGAIECHTLPLKEEAHIVHGNSLQLEWQKVDYILGNPPFIGHQWRSAEQKADMASVFGTKGKFGKLDYVACWYKKAVEMIKQQPKTRCAFVSTNSLFQGEQAGIIGEYLFNEKMVIQFAHRTFQWTSQAKDKAAVHCVIVGFGLENPTQKWLFDYPDIQGEPEAILATNINQYLANGASVILPSRSQPLKGMSPMTKGSQPTDGGNLILSPTEHEELVTKYPKLTAYIKKLIGSNELINGVERYCLWFADTPASLLAEFDKYPEIKARKEAIRTLRLASPTTSVQECAKTPYLFTQNRQPTGSFLAVPEVSSERRHYIPMDFLTDCVPSNLIYTIPNATTYLFGILISKMHMAWARTVAGRLKSDYRYTPNVYHSFPFPKASEAQQTEISKLAETVLAVRKAEQVKDPKATLAVLYNPDIMPIALRKAHEKLDQAVDKLYRSAEFTSDAERVGYLFELKK